MSWNKIERTELNKWLETPQSETDVKEYWKQILFDFSSDYWRLARASWYTIDTIGYQLKGNIISQIDDIKIMYGARVSYLDGQEYIEIQYHSSYGRELRIPIEWFEDRNAFCEKWKTLAKQDYERILRESIAFKQEQIEKDKKNLERLLNE